MSWKFFNSFDSMNDSSLYGQTLICLNNWNNCIWYCIQCLFTAFNVSMCQIFQYPHLENRHVIWRLSVWQIKHLISRWGFCVFSFFAYLIELVFKYIYIFSVQRYRNICLHFILKGNAKRFGAYFIANYRLKFPQKI